MFIPTTFKPAWWLRNRHLQTIFPSLVRKPPNLPNYHRERFITPDDDFIDVDFCGEKGQPLVILLHGLTGSSESGYIKGLQSALVKDGFRSAGINFRGCSGQPNNRARSYHSGETQDIDFLYRILRQREPNIPMATAGFSLGGNVLLKWLGEQGSRLDLFGAVAVSVPLVLSTCATKLDTGFAKVYRKNLIDELITYMDTKLEHLETVGHSEEADKVKALGDLSRIQSFWEYDDCVVARLHGFADVHDYYRRSSSRQYLKSINIPTLLIQAMDDPFMTPEVLPEADEMSGQVRLEVTVGGGHVGFVGGRNPFRPRYWLDERIPAFFLEHLSH